MSTCVEVLPNVFLVVTPAVLSKQQQQEVGVTTR